MNWAKTKAHRTARGGLIKCIQGDGYWTRTEHDRVLILKVMNRAVILSSMAWIKYRCSFISGLRINSRWFSQIGWKDELAFIILAGCSVNCDIYRIYRVSQLLSNLIKILYGLWCIFQLLTAKRIWICKCIAPFLKRNDSVSFVMRMKWLVILVLIHCFNLNDFLSWVVWNLITRSALNSINHANRIYCHRELLVPIIMYYLPIFQNKGEHEVIN